VIGISGDLLKGIIPVLVGISLGFDLLAVALAGLAAVSGQMWPVFLKFDGEERGNTVGLGMAGALAFHPFLIALVPIAIGAGIRTIPRLFNPNQSLNERLKLGGPPSRGLPLGMAVGFFVLPIASWQLAEPVTIIIAYSVLFILLMVRRLTAGLKDDLIATGGVKSILVNRLLYDRSYLNTTEESTYFEDSTL
jgi:glycerol-3-phosphate acyltransferase PlsY